MKKILAITILFASCQFEFKGEEFIQSELMPYYEQFKHEAAIRNVKLPDRGVLMFIDPDHTSSRAHCDWNNNRVTIRISKEYYDYWLNVKDAPYQIEATIFHELGHGLLDRHHIPYDENRISLMVVGTYRYDYFESRTEYLDELFYEKTN